MSGPVLRDRLLGVEWGVATAGSLAAPLPGRPGHYQQWSADVGELVGSAPVGFRGVLGWAHVQPDGPGRWDTVALDRCDRAVDGLLARGLHPGLTLLHRDLPLWLEASGGWRSRDTALRFAEYAAAMGDRFGDRVARWFTSSDLGASSLADCVAGMSPTGRGFGPEGLPAVHHLLLASGLGAQVLSGAGVRGGIGTTVTLMGGYPATDDPWDRIAVERLEAWSNRLFLDPMLLGEHMVDENGRSPIEESGCVRPGDLEIISTPQDLLGLSWHAPCRVTVPENLPRVLPALGCFQALNDLNRLLVRLGFAVVPFEGVETGPLGWPILPEALADALASLSDLYGDRLPALHVIDNGMGDLGMGDLGMDALDGVDQQGDADPARRRAVLAARLSWLAGVMACGVDVRGYEYWSVLDNIEWKLRYSRLYAVAVPSSEPLPQPAIPRDWSHLNAFDDEVRTGAPGPLVALSRESGAVPAGRSGSPAAHSSVPPAR